MVNNEHRVRDETVPCFAQHDQVVEIHWRLPNGQIYTDRRTCPPQATVTAKSKKKGS